MTENPALDQLMEAADRVGGVVDGLPTLIFGIVVAAIVLTVIYRKIR